MGPGVIEDVREAIASGSADIDREALLSGATTWRREDIPLSDHLIEKEKAHIRRFLNALNPGEFHVYSTDTPVWRRHKLI